MRLAALILALALPSFPQDFEEDFQAARRFLIRGRVLLEDGARPPLPPAIFTTCSTSLLTTWNTFTLAFPVGMSGASFPACRVTAALPGYRTASSAPQPGMVLVLKRLGDTEGSLVSLASLSAPQSARKIFEKAESAAYQKQRIRAKDLYRQAIAAYPGYSAAWFALGSVLESENDLSAAADAYQQSVSTDPRFIKPLVALADLSLRASDWPRALHYAERALALNPIEFPRAYLQHALAATQLGQLDKAESSARKCVDLDHAHTAPGALFLLASLLERRNDTPAARDLYRRYLDAAPGGSNAPAARDRLAAIGPR